MAVKIRLARRGRKRAPFYHIVVADAKAPRDGKFIKKLGTYDPTTNPRTIRLDHESTLKYLLDGAQPTPTTKSILSDEGILYKKHLGVGVKKGKLTQEEANSKYDIWYKQKPIKQTQDITNKSKLKLQEGIKKDKTVENKVIQQKIENEKASEIKKESPEKQKPEVKKESPEKQKPETKKESPEKQKPETKKESPEKQKPEVKKESPEKQK